MVKEESQKLEMNEKASIISAIPIFKGLQEGQLSDLAEIAVEKHFDKTFPEEGLQKEKIRAKSESYWSNQYD